MIAFVSRMVYLLRFLSMSAFYVDLLARVRAGRSVRSHMQVIHSGVIDLLPELDSEMTRFPPYGHCADEDETGESLPVYPLKNHTSALRHGLGTSEESVLKWSTGELLPQIEAHTGSVRNTSKTVPISMRTRAMAYPRTPTLWARALLETRATSATVGPRGPFGVPVDASLCTWFLLAFCLTCVAFVAKCAQELSHLR